MAEEQDLLAIAFGQQRQDASARYVTQEDPDPEKAADALNLSKDTGLNPKLVREDYDNVKRDYKNHLAKQLINTNPHVASYINSDPLAAEVSNRDIGNLDRVSQLQDRMPGWSIGKIPSTIFAKTMEGLYEGATKGGDGFGSWITWEGVKQNRWLYSIVSGVGAPAELVFSKIPSALVEGARQGGEEFGRQVGMPAPEKLGKELGAMVEWAMTRGDMKLHGGAEPKPAQPMTLKDAANPLKPQELALPPDIRSSIELAMPYVKAGKEPPIGLSKHIDDLIAKQAEVERKAFEDLQKQVDKAETKELAPEMMEKFLKQKDGGNIEVPAEAVRKLYGEKEPTPGDGIFGDVPGIVDQIKLAEMGGGDIVIPRAFWLTRVEKEVARALHDDMRVRPGSVTRNEETLYKDHTAAMAEAVKDIQKEAAVAGDVAKEPTRPAQGQISSGDPTIDAIRKAGALEPMFDLAREKKLRLQANAKVVAGQSEGMKNYQLVDEKGKPYADLTISEKEGGKVVYVEDIAGKGQFFQPNNLGKRVIRDMLEQFAREYPEAEFLSGFRVSGAREAAGTVESHGEVRIPLRRGGRLVADADVEAFMRHLEDVQEGEKLTLGPKFTGIWKELEQYPEVQQKLILDMQDLIAKIAGDKVSAHPLAEMNIRGRVTRGAYQEFEKVMPAIYYAMNHPETVARTVRHEALHHLRRHNFFTPQEWAVLEKEAKARKWEEMFDIEGRYDYAKADVRIEEAIAEGYSHWAARRVEPNGVLAKIWQKMADFFQQMADKVAQAFGKEPKLAAILKRIESGEVAERGPGEPVTEARGLPVKDLRGDTGPKEPELPGLTRMEDRDAIEAGNRWGMDAKRWAGYKKKVEAAAADDIAHQQKVAEAQARKEQTPEWKENRARIVDELRKGIDERPDIAAWEFFTKGRLYGEKTKGLPKLNPETLPEGRTVPKEMLAKDGMAADDVANLFGYQTAADMLDRLAMLDRQIKESGLEPAEFKKKMIQAQADALMKERYGDLEKNIFEAAKEHVLSPSQLDMLHEDVVFLAEKAGVELPIHGQTLKRQLEMEFDKVKASEVSSDRFLATAGKVGRAAEMELLKDKWDAALRLAEKRELSARLASLAKQVEKDQEKFDRTIKRFSKREVTGVEQEFTDHIQKLLNDAGIMGKRSAEELAHAIEGHGSTDFKAFVQDKQAFGWELYAADDILNGKVKPFKDMTVGEFREFKDTIDSLAYVGKEINKIEVAGEKMDFADFRKKVLDNITQLPVRDKDSSKKWRFRADAELTRMEEIVKDLDLRRDLGPLFDSVIRPMMDSKFKEYNMLEKLGKDLDKIKGADKKWMKSLDDSIPNDFFVDPYDGVHFDMTREHMVQIMLNFGNRSNIEKFTQGYSKVNGKVDKLGAQQLETKLWKMFEDHATKEDWHYVESIWGIFKDWQGQIDTLYRNLSGVAPVWIEPAAFKTKHGDHKGGYYPVIYDRLRSDISVIEGAGHTPKSGPFEKDYYRATTSASHTKTRTGFSDPIQFQTSIEQVAHRMQQVIHDIAYRDAVKNVGKVIYDKQIRQAVRKHYGMEYEAQMEPWLKDSANHFNQNEHAVGWANSVLRRARFNLMTHALGLNLKVLLSPDLGSFRPWDIGTMVWNHAENAKVAATHSREIPHIIYNMDRDFREKLESTITNRGWTGMQATAARWAMMPMVKVSQEFRTLTFVSKFKDEVAKGRTEAEAAVLADSMVREKHGAASISDLPPIMRSNEAMKLSTVFYGFFNTMYNWQRQLPGNFRRGEWKNGMENLYGSVLIPAAFGALLFNQQKKEDSWFKTMGKALVLQPLQTVVFAREFANYFIEGFPPRTPLESVMVAVSSAARDVERWRKGQEVKKPIEHAANVVGLTTGLPLAQIGRTSQFAWDVHKGKQRPKNILQWMRGVIQGEAENKK